MLATLTIAAPCVYHISALARTPHLYLSVHDALIFLFFVLLVHVPSGSLKLLTFLVAF